MTATIQLTHITPEVLTRLAQLVEGGTIKVRVGKVFPLNQATEAFQFAEEGHARGKVVLEMKQG